MATRGHRSPFWFAVGLAALCSFASADAGAADDAPAPWPGWRGLNRQGRWDGPAVPVTWSATSNIAWKTRIPGQGHSSPVVSRDAVYVTTAERSPRARLMLQTATFVLFLSLFPIAAFTFAWLARGDSRRDRDSPSVRPSRQSVLIGLAGYLVLCLGAVTEPHVAFEWTGAEKWILTVCFVTLCLGMAAALPGCGRGILFAVGGLALAFSAWLAVTGMGQPPAHWEEWAVQARLWVAALPAALGLTLVGRAALRPSAVDILPNPPPAAHGDPLFAPRMALRFVIPAVLLGVVLLLVGILLHTRPNAPSAVKDLRLRWMFGPLLTPLFALFCIGCLVALPAIEAHRQRPPRQRTPLLFRIALVVAAGAFLLGTVWGDAQPGFVRSILCLDRVTGRVRWSWRGLDGPREPLHPENSPATPTPAVDGDRVYAYFGIGGLVCCTTAGRHLWTCSDLPHESAYGAASSPVLWAGDVLLIGAVRQDRDVYRGSMVRVNGQTGRPVWKQDLNMDMRGRNAIHRTPLVVEVRGRTTVLVWAREEVAGYEADSGRERWRYRVDGLACTDPVASPVAGDGRVYLAARDECVALDLERLAENQPPTVWRVRRPGPGCSSPVLSNGRLFWVSETGRASCVDAANGTLLWARNLAGTFYASPVAAGPNLYVCNTAGRLTVIRLSGEPAAVAENDAGEKVFASPALAEGTLFLRGERHLFGIKTREAR